MYFAIINMFIIKFNHQLLLSFYLYYLKFIKNNQNKIFMVK